MRVIRSCLENKLTIIITMLFMTDIAILLDVPFLRQILGVVCFTTMPGLLVLYILKLGDMDTVKKFVLSFGLSISFLIFSGLFINSLYPLIEITTRPLSTFSLVISFSILMVILCFVAHKRNKNEFDSWKGFNIKFRLGIKDNQLISPLIFSLLFPFISVFGVYLMNITGNNIILLAIPLLIIIYASFVVYFNKQIPKITYPVAILMISLALVLMLPLRGEYMLIGGDGSVEYHYFWLTATNAYWNIELSRGGSAINACLSVTLLHSIFQSLLGLTMEFTYKLVTPLLLFVTPLALFILFKNYIQESYAFLAALFFASQYPFVYCINARTSIGIVFFALSMVVFFDKKIDKLNNRILFLIFMFSLILSYYSYSYIFAILMFLSWMIVSVASEFTEFKKNITLPVVTLCITVIFLWWSQITESHFTTAIHFIENSFRSLMHASITESSDIVAQKAVGTGLQGAPEILNFVIYYITLILIAIGSIDLLRRWKSSDFGIEFTSMVLSCLTLWAIMIVAPYISEGFGLERVYFPTLIILAPCMIIGAQVICQLLSFETYNYIRQKLKSNFKIDIIQSKSINSKYYHKYVVLIILIVIISNLFVSTGITYQIFGNHRSVILNSDGLQYDIWYVHNQEITAGKWLMEKMERGRKVYTDAYTHLRFAPIRKEEGIIIDNTFFRFPRQIGEGYIFLRYQNVVDGTVYTWYVRKEWSEYAPLTNYSHLFVGKSRIYDNGGSEVWR